MPRSSPIATRPTIVAVLGIGTSLAGLAFAAPSIALGGLVLAVGGLVLRPRAAPAPSLDEPTWLAGDSTDFVRSALAPQDALPANAPAGEFWRPTCVRCGREMVDGAGHGEAGARWSCAGAPDCTFTLPLRAG